MLRLAIVLALAAAIPARAHRGHEHPPAHAAAPAGPAAQVERARRISAINAKYVAAIKPIFQAKCFDCHSGATRFPWYHKIPGVKQFIDSDIAEAREHMDFSADFPFKGHGGSPERDLEELGATIVEGDMPPWYYIPFHSGSRLSKTESAEILAWVKESRELLFWDQPAK